MIKKLRLGIIGCGAMAGSHLQGLLELSDQMTVTATCDIDLKRGQVAAEKLGAEVAVKDYRELLDHVDAVLIALPHDLHFEVGLACLQANKHVLMEKPLALNEKQGLELIAEADHRNLTLMTAYPVRFWPVIQQMKDLVDKKVYGDVFQMSIWTEQFTKYPEGHWINSEQRLGGGQFFSHGCHYVDLLLWFLGKPIEGSHMGTRLGTPWLEGEGTSNVVLKFEQGVLGYHFGTWGARGTRLGYSIHIHCTEGMLEYNHKERKLFLHSNIKEEKANLNTESSTQVLYEETDMSKKTQYELLHFIQCVRDGTPSVTSGPQSLQGLRVIWRLYEAERNQTIADLRGLGLEEDWQLVINQDKRLRRPL